MNDKVIGVIIFIVAVIALISGFSEGEKKSQESKNEYYDELLWVHTVSFTDGPEGGQSSVSCTYTNKDKSKWDIQAMCVGNRSWKSCILTLDNTGKFTWCQSIWK